MLHPARLASLADNRVIPLDGPGPWTLGRGEEADGRFEDPYCSRLQARVGRAGDGFVLEAVSQSAETWLNGRVVNGRAAVKSGDEIAFAGQRLVFSVALPQGETTMIALAGAKAALASPQAPNPQPTGRIALAAELVLGRAPGEDGLALAHPAVSRRHAVISATAGGHEIKDLGSTNGTFVNGSAITGARRLAPGDRIDIGPYSFVFDGRGLDGGSREGQASLAVRGVSVDVRDNTTGRPLRILDRIALDIRPREFVCIIGASGSGKSTLMGVLSARRPASAGAVTLNGLDLYRNFEALKQDVSFVPQNDILHEQLTLRQALTYAARLRLPPDIAPAARAEIVVQAAKSVDLDHRLDVKIATLSGGQKKRASLACEILNRPSLLFLDEVTSGLDESTDREIMRLLRRLADEGMTIVCVTHTLTNIEEFADRVIALGAGGHLTFAGPPKQALSFFGVARLGLVFDRLDEEGAEFWRDRFAVLRGAIPVAVAAPESAQPKRAAAGGWTRRIRQFRILIDRGATILIADRRNLIMAAVQSTVIGVLMGLAFQDFGADYQQAPSTIAMLMLLAIAALWLGCNGASKDIVGELAIYRRERDVNLSTSAYVLSKFTVTGLFTVLQLSVVLVLAAALADRLPGGAGVQFGVLALAALIGTGMGLVISAAADTRDQANTIVPVALVPQLILSGSLVPNLPGWIDALSRAVISTYWITETMIAVAIGREGPLRQVNLAGIMSAAKAGKPFDFAHYGEIPRQSEPAALGLAILLLHIVALVAGAIVIMRRRHRVRLIR